MHNSAYQSTGKCKCNKPVCHIHSTTGAIKPQIAPKIYKVVYCIDENKNNAEILYTNPKIYKIIHI